MGKLFAFLLVLLAIYLFRRALAKPSAPPSEGRASPPAGPQAERMVECAHCGLNVPESESVKDGEEVFCSQAHRQAYHARE